MKASTSRWRNSPPNGDYSPTCTRSPLRWIAYVRLTHLLAAGERIRLKGKYEYNGRTRYEFDDAAEHRRSGSGGCSHGGGTNLTRSVTTNSSERTCT